MPHKQPHSQRRIVSKSTYLKQAGRKLLNGSFGAFILIAGTLGCLVVLLTLFLFLFPSKENSSKPDWSLIGPLALVIGISIYALWIGWRETKAAIKAPLDLPLTRGAIDNLRPEESLVRGSIEPPVEASTILLRAARNAEETPPEQLLRAGHSGAEENE